MKKIALYIATIIAVATVTSSCESFYNINTSPDNPVVVTADQVLPTLLFYTAQSQYDHAEYGAYLSQALTTGGRAQVSGYAYKNGWEFLSMNRHPQWRRHYYDIGVNVNSMIDAAEEIKSPNFILIGRTLKANSTLITTDAFGDMPHSEAYQSIQPKYDTQESIYQWLETELDELIELYNDPSYTECATNKTITTKMDRIYSGDLKKWQLYTKAIKARMLIRKLPNWDNTPATCQRIITLVDEILNDGNWQEPLYQFDGSGSGEKNCPWGPSQPTCNLGWAQGRANLLTDAIPSKFFGYGLLGMYMYQSTTIIPGYALDPRAEKMMTPRANGDGAKTLRYIENNIGMPTSMKLTYYPDLYAPNGNNPYTRDNGYIALITTEELMFIKAEAQYWSGDKIGAYNTTVEAVKKSMERYGVTTNTTYETNRYNLFFEVRLPSAESFTIADLMQQKYVAMYLQSEQWTDVRRYNYSSATNGIAYDNVFVYTVKKCHPEGCLKKYTAASFTEEFSLTRPYNLYEAYWTTPKNYGINAKFSPNAWVNRLNYDPETEDKYNRAQLEQLGAYKNPDWLRKRMIWAKKNNNFVTCSDATEWE